MAPSRPAVHVRFAPVTVLSIPSPGDPFLINSGPIHARWYGLLLAMRRPDRGLDRPRASSAAAAIDPELAYSIAVWAVPFGLAGARLYHVATDWDAFRHDLSARRAGDLERRALDLRRRRWAACSASGSAAARGNLPFWVVADCIAPGLVLAQALGRWGNYFNQELYGKPTDRPWGARRSTRQHRIAPYQGRRTFQPMFLFESILEPDRVRDPDLVHPPLLEPRAVRAPCSRSTSCSTTPTGCRWRR